MKHPSFLIYSSFLFFFFSPSTPVLLPLFTVFFFFQNVHARTRPHIHHKCRILSSQKKKKALLLLFSFFFFNLCVGGCVHLGARVDTQLLQTHKKNWNTLLLTSSSLPHFFFLFVHRHWHLLQCISPYTLVLHVFFFFCSPSLLLLLLLLFLVTLILFFFFPFTRSPPLSS